MPTARPIIIEKFIDHTEIGEIRLSRCSDANPVAMPAIARISGMPAASIAPKAMNSMISVGRPESSSALCSASSFIWLKSAHTGHSPVTSAVAPSAIGQLADEVAEFAGGLGTVLVLADLLLDRDQRRQSVLGDHPGLGRHRQRIGDRQHARPVRQLGFERLQAGRDRRRSGCPAGRRRSGSPHRARGSPCGAPSAPARRSSPSHPSPHPTAPWSG